MPSRVPAPKKYDQMDGQLIVPTERRAHLGLIPVPSKLLMHRNTWFLKMDGLLSATSLPRCYVILILGAPTYKDLTPILLSGQYAHSLVIIAARDPPEIPNLVIPALRILHLSKPLSTENNDTTRLVSILTWAERVASDWRQHGGSGIYELSENDEDDTLPSGKHSGPNVLRVGRYSARRHSMPVNLPTSNPLDGKRPFDVLMNFLPNQLPDNVMLRHTIFITTISRPFFKSAPTASSLTRGVFARAKFFFGGSQTSIAHERRSLSDMPRTHVEALLTNRASTIRPLASEATPQIIHLLPPDSTQYPQASARLVDSMEAFIAAFACTTSLEAGGNSKKKNVADNAQSYIMHAGTLGRVLDCALARFTREGGSPGKREDPWGCEWTVADVLISGALDNAPTLTRGTTSSAGSAAAWISGPEDISLVPTGETSASARTVPVVLDMETRPLLYKTPTKQGQPVRVSMETAARMEQAAVEATARARRPISPASTYSTSYGHETGLSPPPSFHEYQDSAYVVGPADIGGVSSSGAVEEVRSEESHTPAVVTASEDKVEPPAIEEIPADTKEPVTEEPVQNITEIVLPRRVSVKRVQSFIAGWKDMGAWRSKRMSVDAAR